MMKNKPIYISGCHVPVEKFLTLKEIASKLSGIGLIPLFRSARQCIAEQLRPLALNVPLACFDMGQREVFTSKDGGRAVFVRMDYDHSTLGVHVLDLFLVARGESAALRADVERSLGLPLRENSWLEAYIIKKLKENFGELSRNGKKLIDAPTRQAIRRYYDDNTRRAQKPKDGLWLESLAHDILLQRTKAAWAGQMVGPSEVDVLAVHVERTVLIECKDKNIGQNEIHVADGNSEQLGANVVIFLTTKGLHREAQKVLDNVRAMRKGQEFHVVNAPKAEDLSVGLNRILDNMERTHIEWWMRGESARRDLILPLLQEGWFEGEQHPLL